MTGFHRERGPLACDGVDLDAIAEATGTPVHVYSHALLAERYRALDAAAASLPHRLHYALKANATLAVVRALRALGARADANSGGEIEIALRAGFAPADIVFTGVGKTADELDLAVSLDLGAVNAESPGEVERLAARARALGRRVRVAVRINPDIDAGSHPHISTGRRTTKFGFPAAEAGMVLRDIAGRRELAVVGLHVHIGSQITALAPIAAAAIAAADLARELGADGITLEHLDLGGGLGIAYEPGQAVIGVADYIAAIRPAVEATGLALVLEPGRWIVGPAGVLLTRIVDLKRQPGRKWFVVTDAGMTDLMRPALYGAYHYIEPVHLRDGRPIQVDVVGPVCETADTLGRDRDLPPVSVGDLLAVRDTGAYGAVMASNYNRRPTAAEVLVDGAAWRVVRRRQTVDDLLRWDD